jgi:hypothetical protein
LHFTDYLCIILVGNKQKNLSERDKKMKTQNGSEVKHIAKYNQKENCMYCPACKTYEVCCDATGTLSIPHGFGFLPGESKFAVVRIEYTGFFGWCEHCREKIFNWKTTKPVKTYPKQFNKAI